jgi:hypothetical protein
MWRSLLTDGLPIIVSDHHDDEFGLLGNDDLPRHLRPFATAALMATLSWFGRLPRAI